MKRVKNTTPKDLEGNAFRLPVIDPDGQPVLEDGKLKSVEGDLIANLRALVKFFPRDKMTMANVIEANKLWRCLDASDGKVIVMEEGTHDWLRAQLKDDKVGVFMFGMNLPAILEAVDEFVPKE